MIFASGISLTVLVSSIHATLVTCILLLGSSGLISLYRGLSLLSCYPRSRSLCLILAGSSHDRVLFCFLCP
jgi:hypothetical protein